MTKYITPERFDNAMDKIDAKIDGVVATFKEEIRGFVTTQIEIRQELNEIKDDLGLVKTAVVETADTGHHLFNLTKELRKHGVPVEDRLVFKKS